MGGEEGERERWVGAKPGSSQLPTQICEFFLACRDLENECSFKIMFCAHLQKMPHQIFVNNVVLIGINSVLKYLAAIP